ncbi:MAG: ACT domain-containing protein [Oscillospiraceae bacterium]|nr:ACT domain-containing protein [Oscillospiraceae bacterium]
MKFTSLDLDFSICKIKDTSDVDFSLPFVFLSKTDDEISLVCESAHVPTNAIAIEPNWKGFRIDGSLDFTLVGVIANITKVLADAEISVFVVSTYNTDYIFLKSNDFDRGLDLVTKTTKNG